MSSSALPTPKDVRDLLSDLLGRQVEVVAHDAPATPLAAGTTVGVYHDDRHNTVAVVTADLSLSAHLAAAIALTTKDGAEEAVRNRCLPATYTENLHEVLNVLGTLFNGPSTPATRLDAMHAPGEPVPPRTAELAGRTGHRVDMAVSIPAYGSGELGVVM